MALLPSIPVSFSSRSAPSLSLGLICTTDLLLVDFKGIAILHIELSKKSSALISSLHAVCASVVM
jgi:hypothetical protein